MSPCHHHHPPHHQRQGQKEEKEEEEEEERSRQHSSSSSSSSSSSRSTDRGACLITPMQGIRHQKVQTSALPLNSKRKRVLHSSFGGACASAVPLCPSSLLQATGKWPSHCCKRASETAVAAAAAAAAAVTSLPHQPPHPQRHGAFKQGPLLLKAVQGSNVRGCRQEESKRHNSTLIAVSVRATVMAVVVVLTGGTSVLLTCTSTRGRRS